MQRKASARWQGTVKEGKGSISTQSGVLNDAPYGFNARFGDGKGTNPEELLGAAHAGCFTMALSFALNNAGFTAEAIDTEAAVTLEKVNDAWTITAIHLTTRAQVPSIDAAKFAEIAGGAKANCPVSRVLNATITMDAKLGGWQHEHPSATTDQGARRDVQSGKPLPPRHAGSGGRWLD